MMVKLGVNIDHVATIRQARREEDPDPVIAAQICERAGAHSIVAHLREDRRHIQDRDILVLRKTVKTRFNLEMSLQQQIVDMACKVRPDQVTLVPERRQELTTEGGLDVVKLSGRIKKASQQLKNNGIVVSLFIEANKKQIQAAHNLGIKMIELHTGTYARAYSDRDSAELLKHINAMCQFARGLGITVNAGHGLNYENVKPIAKIKGIAELNIGHSIVSRAVFVGMEKAVKEMVSLLK